MTIGLSYRIRLRALGAYLIYCPGCQEVHELVINSKQAHGKKLGFDGDLHRPSFDPEVRHWVERGLCAYELRAGIMHYAADSFHELAGQDVELPAFPMNPGAKRQ